MPLKVDEIRSFVAVAQSGSFSEAARQLRRAQSVISIHIAGMEAELGYRLFDRTPKPVLTARGRELLMSARRVLVEADRLDLKARSLLQSETPALYMGIDLELEAPVILDLLKLFAKDYPSVKLQIENISSSEAQWFFKKSAMNIALLFSSEASLESEERVLGLSPVCIAVAKTHPLATKSSVTVDDLRQYRQIIINASDSESPRPKIINDDHWEVDSGLWALGLAARGVGWTILPRFLLTGRSSLGSSVVTIKAPFSLVPERLVLRVKSGEVDPGIVQWWTTTITRNKHRLGLDPIPVSGEAQ